MQLNDLGIDYSYARPDLGSLPPEIRFVARYGSHTPAKNISGIEAAGIALSGRELVLVWETTANRVLSGHVGGVDDGHAARQIADGIGYTGLWYWAVDFDIQSPQFDVAEEYGIGFAEGYGCTKADCGPYGGLSFVDEMLRRGFGIAWQTVAWSHGQVSVAADIYQRLNPTIPVPGTDEDVALRTSGASLIVVPNTPANNAVPDALGSDGQRNLFVRHPFLSGDDVGFVQKFCNDALHVGLTTDNVYGPVTAEAVTTLQSGNGLVADGIVGPSTRALMAAIIAWTSSLHDLPVVPAFPGYVRLNDRGPAVEDFQYRLQARGYSVGSFGADGKFGMDTYHALVAFQRDAGISDDGVGGPITWTRLWT